MTYTSPTPADLKARYPAFAALDDASVQPFLDDAEGTDADASWPDKEHKSAVIAAAAHRMSRGGIGGGAGGSAAGVESFRSASVSIQFSSEAAKLSAQGGWASTSYGQDYAELLQRVKGGPRVVGGGYVCGDVAPFGV